MTPEEKRALQLTAVSVREGILTSTHGAKAGHPGGSLSAADVFTYLYFKEMRIDPKAPAGRTGTGSSSPRATLPPASTPLWRCGATSPWRSCPGCGTSIPSSRGTPT